MKNYKIKIHTLVDKTTMCVVYVRKFLLFWKEIKKTDELWQAEDVVNEHKNKRIYESKSIYK